LSFYSKATTSAAAAAAAAKQKASRHAMACMEKPVSPLCFNDENITRAVAAMFGHT